MDDMVARSRGATVIYIDGIQNGDIRGKFRALPSPADVVFHDTYGLIQALTKSAEEWEKPRDGWEPRRKKGRRRKTACCGWEIDRHYGKRATLLMQVYHRQHGTWQGTLRWLDENRLQCFRSVLELICLLREAAVGDA